jgi:hypothetical protein
METLAVEWTEWVVDKLLFWEPDKKRKGRILRAAHHFFSYAILILIIISHTLYPAFWLQTSLLFLYSLIWLHHVVTNGCVVSKIEQRWLEDDSSFIDPFLDIVHVDVSNESKPGILILGSTLVIFMLSLEWVSRLRHYVTPLLIRLVESHPPALVSVPNIPLPMSSQSI